MATLSAGVQRAGGSVQHPMSKLDDALEFMAAYVEARDLMRRGMFSGLCHCTTHHTSGVMAGYAKRLHAPAVRLTQ